MSEIMEIYNPSYKEGLTSEQVSKRQAERLVNYDEQPKTKTTKEIIKSNCFKLSLGVNNNKNVSKSPVPNIIKSVTLKKPSINIDFFELAGIK